MAEEKRTPAYVSYKTFKNTLKELEHVPSTIDYSVFATMNGSTRNFFFGALRFFELIDAQGLPSPKFQALAGADDAKWKREMRGLVEHSYAPAQIKELQTGTMSSLRKSFGEEIGQSVVSPACRFLIAAAKDCELPVSPTIAAAKVSAGTGPRKKRAKPGPQLPPATTRKDELQEDPTVPQGMMVLPIPFVTGESGVLRVPKKFTSAHLGMVKAVVGMLEQYAQQAKGEDDD